MLRTKNQSKIFAVELARRYVWFKYEQTASAYFKGKIFPIFKYQIKKGSTQSVNSYIISCYLYLASPRRIDAALHSSLMFN